MKINKYLVLSICGFLGAGILTSCGKPRNPTSDSQDPVSSETESVETPTESEGPVVSETESTSQGGSDKTIEVAFWHTFGQGIQDQLSKKIEEFQSIILEEEGVKVKVTHSYQGSYDDIASKISNGFAVGNIPTLAIAYPDHVANYLYTEGNNYGKYVVNFEDYFDNPEYGYGKNPYLGDEYDETDIIPAFLEEGQQFIREGTYCFPLMKSTEVMFYNKEQVDILLPLYDATLNTEAARTRFLNSMSWDQFLDVCETAINNKSSLVSSLERPAFYDSDSNLFISKMFQNEIPYSSINSDTQKGQIDFETGQANTDAKAMVASIKEAYDKGLITTKGCEGTYGSDAFTAEESLFSIGSSGGAGYNFPDSETFTVGVCRVPASNNNPLYVSQGPSLCMLKNTSLSDSVNRDSLEYAWKFVKFLTNTENNIELCIVGSEGYVPVRESSYETELYFDFLANGENYATVANVVVDDISGNYLNAAVFTGSDKLRDQVGGIISTVLLNHATIDEAFAEAINTTKLFIK